MDLIYNLTRQEAAELLDVSTRTIDRYVKRWTISYQKHANKIMLSEQEIISLKDRFSNPQQNTSQVLVADSNFSNNPNSSSSLDVSSIVELIKEKDSQIEAKNALIFNMQHNIWMLESKLSNMIALPDYNKEKEALELVNQKYLFEKENLSNELKKEKIKNIIYLSVLIFVVLIYILISLF